MRIGTWNCQTGLAPNWEHVQALDSDVLTVQECGPETKEFVESHSGWTCEWQAGRYREGVAVLAREPFRIASTELSEPCVLSVVIGSPASGQFRFVGFWAMTPVNEADGYPQQATRLIKWLPQDDLPTMVAGDFNASSRNPTHLSNVAALLERGIVSAYHSFHGLEHTDQWAAATSYHQWSEAKPFHMDYIFLPSRWEVEGVEVGTYEEYPAKRLSDHVPIVVSVSLG